MAGAVNRVPFNGDVEQAEAETIWFGVNVSKDSGLNQTSLNVVDLATAKKRSKGVWKISETQLLCQKLVISIFFR